MKIKILKSAKEDLKEGFHFYELQQKGLGSYFLESLKLFAGILEPIPLLISKYKI